MKIIIIAGYVVAAIATGIFVFLRFYKKNELKNGDNVVNALFYTICWPLFWLLFAVTRIGNLIKKKKKK